MYGPVPPLRSKIVRNLILAATVAAALHAQAGAAEAATCADAAHPGGDWQGYGHDYSNTRHQEKETAIGPLDAPILSPAWALKTEGEISGTPAVVDGCLYVGTTAGFVYAVNADTGEPVWTAEVPDGGVINASLYVSGGRVFAAVARDSAPYLIALDQADGTLLWKRQLDSQPGSETPPLASRWAKPSD